MNDKVSSANRKYFSLWDLIFIALAIVIGITGTVIALVPHSGQGRVAVVSVGGQVFTEIDLASVTSPYELTVEGEMPTVLYVCEDGVCFLTSDCPDKFCVNTGFVSEAGQSAVCLPARVSVKIVADSTSEAPDAVAG